jgi:RNA polymerase sigma-70 factor (ECF subfamily)
MNFDPSEVRVMVRIATQRTGSPVHDEDLEQDAILKAVEAFRKQREVRNPRAFLMKIVRDAVRDHWRRRRRLEDLDGLDESRLAQLPTFEDDLDQRRLKEALRQALTCIEREKRVTLDLFYMENRSIVEIARLQNKSTSAVKMQLVRARRLLAGIVRNLSDKKSR